MSYWVSVSPQEDFQGTSPPGMLPFVITVSNTKEHDQSACMGMFAPADLLAPLAFRPKHAQRVASFIALQAVRNIKHKEAVDEQSLAASMMLFDMDLTKHAYMHSQAVILVPPPQNVNLQSRHWPRQYSLIELAHQAQVEARKITLEQVALAARGPEQIQDPAKPKM